LFIRSDDLAIDLLLNNLSNELAALAVRLNGSITVNFLDFFLNLGSEFLGIDYSVKLLFVSEDSLCVHALFEIVD
jgi:hypothetical protein